VKCCTRGFGVVCEGRNEPFGKVWNFVAGRNTIMSDKAGMQDDDFKGLSFPSMKEFKELGKDAWNVLKDKAMPHRMKLVNSVIALYKSGGMTEQAITEVITTFYGKSRV
jgi:hypothetical protein